VARRGIQLGTKPDTLPLAQYLSRIFIQYMYVTLVVIISSRTICSKYKYTIIYSQPEPHYP